MFGHLSLALPGSPRLVMRALVLGCALAAAALADDGPEERQARALMRSAKEAFDAGDFTKAAELLKQVRTLAPTPATLYNLGRALELARDLQGAEDAYREYLTAAPTAPDRRAVEANIRELRHRIDARQTKPAEALVPSSVSVVSVAPLPPPRPVRAVRVLPWVLAGVGVVALGAAVGFGVAARDHQAGTRRLPDAASIFRVQNEAQGFADTANGLYLAGGLTTGAGLVWGLLSLLLGSDA